MNNKVNYQLLNGGSLAFMGDAVYENRIRKYVLDKGLTNLRLLHNECVKYVSRTSQDKIISWMISHSFLTETELDIYKRGRNYDYKQKTPEYINASGFEAIIGYLYLEEAYERLDCFMNQAIMIVNNQ